MEFGPLLYMAERGSELELDLIEPPKQLYVEEPIWVECVIANRSPRTVNLQLSCSDVG